MSTHMDRDTFIAQTVDWLNRRVVPEGVTVDADTRLFDAGVIDSLSVLKLIAWTERTVDRVIPDREIRMDRFGSVRDMASHFVQPAVAAKAATCASCTACGRCARRAA